MSRQIDPPVPAALLNSAPAGLMLALGSAGVVVTSLFYGLSPPEAAMPMMTGDVPAAARAAREAAGLMRGAGLAGVPGDIAMAASTLLLGALASVRGHSIAALGWFLIAISTIIFTMVDALVGFVLAPAAMSDAALFMALKRLFDILFLSGTLAFGVGAIATMRQIDPAILPQWSRVAVGGIGLVAAVSALLIMAGVLLPAHIIGLSIAAGAVSYTLIGIRIFQQAPGQGDGHPTGN